MRLETAPTADLVFVLSKQGKPLMPCRPAKARRLLWSKKARIVRKTPFTIRLREGSTGYIQTVVAGMDTGSKKLGCAAVGNRNVLYQSEVTLRPDVSSKMEQRRMYRRTRRSRKTRYRPARFDNRGKEGKLAPSLLSKVQSHFREKRFVESILPVQEWKVELASFDIHKISNPNVSKHHGWTYQNGNQKDFYNLKAYILFRDEYTCQNCPKGQKKEGIRLHVHHIVFRSQGGTDSPTNLITLCETCHEKLHAGSLGNQVAEKLKKKCSSKTKHPTEMGIVKSQILKSGWIFKEAFGFETKLKREQYLQLPKTHCIDALAICLTDGEQPPQPRSTAYLKKHVAKGDYQQTSGARSEKKIPTGKLFGFRKFDLIQSAQGTGFIKGKRSSGYFALAGWDGAKIHDSVNIKKDCIRVQARTSTLTHKGELRLLLGLKAKVSAAGDIR